MAIDREGSTCCFRTNNAIKIGLPLGHAMSPPSNTRRADIALPVLSVLLDASHLDETFQILNTALEKAKGGGGGGGGGSNSAPTPVEALERLQVMLDRGLITKSEFDQKRQEVLKKF
jgi:hypothetical protein